MSHPRTALFVALMILAAAVPAHPAVVIELFTTQGCSSCPPADRLLTAMGQDPDLGRQVVPLAYHVDYWNRLGWRDPFSDAAWTRRQNDYVRLAGGTQVYTPQTVVNGGAQCVGSDVPCIRRAVEAAAAQPAPKVAVSLAPPAGDAIAVAIEVEPPAQAPALDVMLAVYELGLETEVKAGENAKKTLHNDYVVRRLQRAFELKGKAPRRELVQVKLDRAWKRERLGVAVFLQDPKSRRIYGGAAAQVGAGTTAAAGQG